MESLQNFPTLKGTWATHALVYSVGLVQLSLENRESQLVWDRNCFVWGQSKAWPVESKLLIMEQ